MPILLLLLRAPSMRLQQSFRTAGPRLDIKFTASCPEDAAMNHNGFVHLSHANYDG